MVLALRRCSCFQSVYQALHSLQIIIITNNLKPFQLPIKVYQLNHEKLAIYLSGHNCFILNDSRYRENYDSPDNSKGDRPC